MKTMKIPKPINFIGDEIYHEPKKDSWWELIMGGVCIVGFAYVMIWWAAIMK